jgi:predicted GNAT family N-acyltransferase
MRHFCYTSFVKQITTKIIVPPNSYEDAKVVRRIVFQKEQGIDGELDFDGNDDTATHVVAYYEKKPIGTGRIRKIADTSAKIERVAVVKDKRKMGIGKLIMKTMDEYLEKSEINTVTLDAQVHAKSFYESLGYVQKGEVFEEVGIPHVVMTKNFRK